MASGDKRKFDGNNRWTEEDYAGRRSYGYRDRDARDKRRDDRDDKMKDRVRGRDGRDREGRDDRPQRDGSRPPLTPSQRRYADGPGSGARALGTSNNLFSEAAKLVQERQRLSNLDRGDAGGSGSDVQDDASEREPGELPKREPGELSKRVKTKHSPIVWRTPTKVQGSENKSSLHKVESSSLVALSPAEGKSSPRLPVSDADRQKSLSFQRPLAEPATTPRLTPGKQTDQSERSLQRLESEDAELEDMAEEEETGTKAKSGVSSRWLDLEDEHSSEEADRNTGKDQELEVSNGAALREDENVDTAQDEQLANGSHDEEDLEEPESPTMLNRAIMMTRECRSVEEFERLNRISEGAYGVVYRARDKKTGRICALKKVKMDKEREGFPMTAIREINIMLSLHHPHIVNVEEVVVGNSLDSIFMVMEFMEHDLKALSEQLTQPFSVSEVKCLLRQLLSGVAYLHENWVIHRDLKTSNLLYNSKGDLKICDFGLARQFGSPLRPYTHMVVTLWYRAPELLLGVKQYSTAIDMWSVGCIMAEWLLKEVLFDGKSEMDQIDKIFKLLGVPSEKTWPTFRELPNVKKLNFKENDINNLRSRFPQSTFDFDGRPFLSDKGFDLLNGLLTLDPAKRITAQEALRHAWFDEQPLPKESAMMPTFPCRRNNGISSRPKLHHPSPDPRFLP